MNFLINIDVDDLQKAISFYSSAFDLRVGRRLSSFGIEMVGGPTPIYLLVKETGSPASNTMPQRRSYARHWTPLHLDVVVDEVEPAVQKAIAAGARLEEPIAEHEWGKLAPMSDPFGHGFCLIQFRGRGYDEIAD